MDYASEIGYTNITRHTRVGSGYTARNACLYLKPRAQALSRGPESGPRLRKLSTVLLLTNHTYWLLLGPGNYTVY